MLKVNHFAVKLQTMYNLTALPKKPLDSKY